MKTIRIPLAGQFDLRTTGNMVASPGFTGQQDQFYLDTVFDAVINPLLRTKTIYPRAREILAARITDGTGASTAVIPWTGKSNTHAAFARGATNSTIYTWDGTTATSLGAITGQGIHMSETLISGTPNIVVISASGRGRTWYYPDAGALTEITDTDFPPKQTPALTITGNAVHKNGRMFVMCTNGQVWNSDLNSLSAWTANNYFTAQDKPDLGVGLALYHDVIVLLGRTSIEFARYTEAASGSPLMRIQDSTIQIGCMNQHSILEFMDTVYWIAWPGTSGFGVYRLNGLKAEKVSGGAIDRYFANTTIATNTYPVRLVALQSEGRQLVGVVNNVIAHGWVFDPLSDMWSQWDFTVSGMTSVNKTAVYGNENLMAYDNGAAHICSNTPGTPVTTWRMQTSNMDLGTGRRKTIHCARWIGDPVAATVVFIYDDYVRTNTVSKTFGTGVRSAVWRCGSGRAFALDVTIPTTTVRRAQAIELEYVVANI